MGVSLRGAITRGVLIGMPICGLANIVLWNVNTKQTPAAKITQGALFGAIAGVALGVIGYHSGSKPVTGAIIGFCAAAGGPAFTSIGKIAVCTVFGATIGYAYSLI